MGNLIEFLRMTLSYLFTFAVIIAVAGVGGFVGLKVWKPKAKIKSDVKVEDTK